MKMSFSSIPHKPFHNNVSALQKKLVGVTEPRSKANVPFLLLFLLIAVVSSSGQTAPVPTPTPSDTDVVKISTNLIRIDITVSDAKGKPVADLRPDEIEVYENGEKRRITGLTYVSSFAKPAAPKPGPVDKNAVLPPPVPLKPDQVRRTFALVVDDLTLSFESVYYVRRALKKFVDEQMSDGDLVAIVRTGAGIGALQQFTSDKRILYAAIDKVRWNANGNGGISSFAPLNTDFPDGTDAAEPDAGERTAEGTEREFNDFRESYFATGALGALEYIIRGMSELPGRKSAIFFSQGFALTNKNAEGFSEGSASLDPMRRLIENANRASVVVYSIDPRGLAFTGFTAADGGSGGRNPQALQAQLSSRSFSLYESQSSLKQISEETGGFALVNNNDVSGGVRRVLEDQSYYLVAYEPDNDTFDPAKLRFNKIEIKLLRSGLTARYRSGFFNVADKEKPALPSKINPTFRQLENALVSPFGVNGIDLSLNALFGNDAKGVSYVRSLIHVDAKNFTFVDAENGSKKAVFEILAASFGDNGQPVDQLAKSYTITVKPAAYERMVANGFVYDFLFPVKKPGAYQYRVAIRDNQGGRIGSASQFIEVPDLKKKRLTVSSLVLENVSDEAWNASISSPTSRYESDPLTDTALRRVKPGSVLRLGFEVYNARLDPGKQPRLNTRIRIFNDGTPVLDGKPTPVELLGQTDFQHIKAARAISFRNKMTPGDYVLQIIVTDDSDPKKPKIATQFVQFEIVG